MDNQPSHLIIAYYHLVAIDNPHAEVKTHKNFFNNRDAKTRIYISHEGINCQMSASYADGIAYIEWLRQRPEFAEIKFKIDPFHEHVFPRVAIKYRRQLVAFDVDVDLSDRGEHLSPQQWKEMLEQNNGHLLLDVRNDYEWDVGRFAGTNKPPCQTSRGFKKFADELKERVDPKKTPIMMYCTGGIRCELFSAILKKDGFDKVYQLDGGIINYGHKEGSKHWEGKLYVFDDRMTTPVGSEGNTVVGCCKHCGKSNDNYFNCANVDCNELYLCCPECVHEYVGCCSQKCTGAERMRPYQQQGPHKPFKRIPKDGTAKKQFQTL